MYDIQDNYSGGKEELTLSLKPQAFALGLRLDDIANQVRHSVFGFEAQRIQRGRDELRVMVRFPLEHRSSVEDLNNLPIVVNNSTSDSTSDRLVKLSDVADITPFESPSTLYRNNRVSLVNVTADFDSKITSVAAVLQTLDADLSRLKSQFPNINYRYDGEIQDTHETNRLLTWGAIGVVIAIYILLAIPFRSYGQPFIVMSVIPFSLLGAVLGHIITLQSLSILSIFGMLALLGVVVNDSLVLVDYINKLRRSGVQLSQAVVDAACIRFRPVLLTSITTFAGLFPILLDTSQQAKWLKPMATSLGCGILFATLVTLIIVPVNYLIAHNAKHAWLAYWHKNEHP